MLKQTKLLALIVSCVLAGTHSLLSAHDKHHSVDELFAKAQVVAGPNLVDCTLSGGTATRCIAVTVKAEPTTYTPGPWCPGHITDGAGVGGIWLEGGEVYDADGEFFKNLSDFYNDPVWQVYDEETGKIRVTDSLESCQAAARPDVDPEYQNHCVQCLPEYMDDDATLTFTIPLTPVGGVDQTFQIRDSGAGVALNGVRLDAPAPVDAILGSYTVAPFDDCGGHVNLAVGYHYHAVTDCLSDTAVTDDHGQIIGVAMDGHLIMARKDSAGQLPDDLDECGGHTVDDNYHYHAGEAGSNAILNCLVAEAGCVSSDPEASCDATATKGHGGGPQQGGKGRPDFAAAAASLGVSEAELVNALGGPPPNVEQAADKLGISVEQLTEVLPMPGR